MPKKVSLNVKCPLCHESLMDDTHLINNKKGIHCIVKITGGKKGNIWLSSIYGDHNYSCEFEIPEGEVGTFYCPHCGQDLKRKKLDCDLCGAPVVSLGCSIGGRVNFCSRSGCKNHYVVFDNVDTAIRKFYSEYGYGS